MESTTQNCIVVRMWLCDGSICYTNIDAELNEKKCQKVTTKELNTVTANGVDECNSSYMLTNLYTIFAGPKHLDYRPDLQKFGFNCKTLHQTAFVPVEDMELWTNLEPVKLKLYCVPLERKPKMKVLWIDKNAIIDNARVPMYRVQKVNFGVKSVRHPALLNVVYSRWGPVVLVDDEGLQVTWEINTEQAEQYKKMQAKQDTCANTNKWQLLRTTSGSLCRYGDDFIPMPMVKHSSFSDQKACNKALKALEKQRTKDVNNFRLAQQKFLKQPALQQNEQESKVDDKTQRFAYKNAAELYVVPERYVPPRYYPWGFTLLDGTGKLIVVDYGPVCSRNHALSGDDLERAKIVTGSIEYPDIAPTNFGYYLTRLAPYFNLLSVKQDCKKCLFFEMVMYQASRIDREEQSENRFDLDHQVLVFIVAPKDIQLEEAATVFLKNKPDRTTYPLANNLVTQFTYTYKDQEIHVLKSVPGRSLNAHGNQHNVCSESYMRQVQFLKRKQLDMNIYIFSTFTPCERCIRNWRLNYKDYFYDMEFYAGSVYCAPDIVGIHDNRYRLMGTIDFFNDYFYGLGFKQSKICRLRNFDEDRSKERKAKEKAQAMAKDKTKRQEDAEAWKQQWKQHAKGLTETSKRQLIETWFTKSDYYNVVVTPYRSTIDVTATVKYSSTEFEEERTIVQQQAEKSEASKSLQNFLLGALTSAEKRGLKKMPKQSGITVTYQLYVYRKNNRQVFDWLKQKVIPLKRVTINTDDATVSVHHGDAMLEYSNSLPGISLADANNFGLSQIQNEDATNDIVANTHLHTLLLICIAVTLLAMLCLRFCTAALVLVQSVPGNNAHRFAKDADEQEVEDKHSDLTSLV